MTHPEQALADALRTARSQLVTLGGDPRKDVAEHGSIMGDEIQASVLDVIDAALTPRPGIGEGEVREILAEECERIGMRMVAANLRAKPNDQDFNAPWKRAALAAMSRVSRLSTTDGWRDAVIEECAAAVEDMVGASESMLEAASRIRALKSPPSLVETDNETISAGCGGMK